jgi:thiamine kinase-like enzyme
VKANCFINGETAQFIDWEYADLHNPWFDLAAIIYYFALNDDQSRTLIAAYNNDWEIKVSEPIFYAAQIALLWCDMLWHLDKFGRDYWSKLGKKRSRIYRLALHLDVNFADA